MNWQPIETCPENTDVLLYDIGDITLGQYRQDCCGEYRFFDWCAGGDTINPSHWMPLPEPPNEA